MSEENATTNHEENTNEVKDDVSEKKEEQVQPQEKIEANVKEEQKQSQKKIEAKRNATPQPNVQTSFKQAEVKPTKKPFFTWEKFGKLCAVAILSIACGYSGGYLYNATHNNANQIQESPSFNYPFSMMPSQGFGNGSQSGDSSGDSSAPFSSKAVLGIKVQATSDDTGVVVVSITDGSNAKEAGLQVGDLITKIDDTQVTTVTSLSEYVQKKEIGDKVKVTYTRDDKESVAEITLVDSNTVQSSSNNKA